MENIKDYRLYSYEKVFFFFFKLLDRYNKNGGEKI